MNTSLNQEDPFYLDSYESGDLTVSPISAYWGDRGND